MDKIMQNQQDKGEIILYQPDNFLKLEVWLRDETVWLSQAQMAELFQTTRNNITMHISNLFKEGELDGFVVCKDFLHTTVGHEQGVILALHKDYHKSQF